MLFSEGKRDREIAEREAAGENLWTEDIGAPVRVRLIEVVRAFDDPLWRTHRVDLAEQVSGQVRRKLGFQIPEDVQSALAVEDPVAILNWLGAAHDVIRQVIGERGAHQFASLVNHVFRQERVGFKFVDGSLVEFASDELSVGVVEPAVRLLVDRRFEAAHGAYMNALREIAAGEPADAITDAGTALQETLSALGCHGNSLGRQAADARKRGLLAGHDQAMTDAIHKFIDWASADRSESGDGHKHADTALADAWLMVHVVGALIVRLADPELRDTSP